MWFADFVEASAVPPLDNGPSLPLNSLPVSGGKVHVFWDGSFSSSVEKGVVG
ncbi:hypothetical protein LguiB_019740 [Lonicera macranthoides]